LEEGPLHRQHLVIYLVGELDDGYQTSFPCFPSTSSRPSVDPAMKLQASEVDLVAWVPLHDVHLLIESSVTPSGTFTALSIDSSGCYSVVAHPWPLLKCLSKREMVEEGLEEGISLGTAFALYAWHKLEIKPVL